LPLPFNSIFTGSEPEDEIDKLFHQLPRIEPAGDFIAQILSRVRGLPGPLWEGPKRRPGPDAGMDALIVRNETREPS